MKYFPKIIGERIYLSPLNKEDAPIYTKWINDRNVSDGLGNTCTILSLEAEKAYFEDQKNNGALQFAIIEKNDDTLLGNVGFDIKHHIHRTATVGIFIGEEEKRNQGFGTEALQLAVGYGFDALNFNNIMLEVFAFNKRAVRSYEKVGFKQIGRRREAYYLDNVYHDVIFMDILRRDWYAQRNTSSME